MCYVTFFLPGMNSKLHRVAPFEAESQLEASLREVFEGLLPKLRPPFSLVIPSPTEYLELNQAILYGILTEPHFAKVHFTHLCAIVTDGYEFFVSLIVKIVFELYTKLLDSVKVQLIWISRKMVDVSAEGVQNLLISLMRQIAGGDYSDWNLWLAAELLRIFLEKWEWLLEEPLVLTSALFTYLRLLADHYRLLGVSKFETLKRMEIDFCICVLRNHFDLCLRIGRDLIRLLQDLSHIPEFQAVCKDLLSNPAEFRALGFSDISQVYARRTSSQYHLLRITPEMETQLRFLLTHVRWRNHRRYQTWFFRKFLSRPECETNIPDIVRFICCAHHPPNEVIQSDVIPRWAIIGWLLKCCSTNHVVSSVKLALFYDWLFYHEKFDNVMNIEPGILLMVNSITKYIDMTRSLLEFLFISVDDYDVVRRDFLGRGVSSAFHVLVRKGVVQSLEVLTSCSSLSPSLRQRLSCMFLASTSESSPVTMEVSPPPCSPLPLKLPCPSNGESKELPVLELRVPESSRENGFDRALNNSISVVDNSFVSCSMPILSCNSFLDAMSELVETLGEAAKNSKEMGLEILEKMLFLFVNTKFSLGVEMAVESPLRPEALAHQIMEAFKENGANMFDPLVFHPLSCTDKIQSAAALVICTFIFSRHQMMQDMIIFWSRNGYQIGPWFLVYASTIAYEADTICSRNLMDEQSSNKLNYTKMPFLKHHIYKYISFMRSQTKNYSVTCESDSVVEFKLLLKLKEDAFISYIMFLQSSDASKPLSKLLFSDLLSCRDWVVGGSKPLFCAIFRYLSDLSTGKEEFIHLLVDHLDHANLVALQFDVCLKRFSLFGPDIETIVQLVKCSLNWDSVEQQKLWGLMISELSVSSIQLEKLMPHLFDLSVSDSNVHSIIVEGLFNLCCRCAPSPELVGMILSLPDGNTGGFAASVLASWVVSNGSMLFGSLVECLEKINTEGYLVLQNSTGVKINNSTTLWLLTFLNKVGSNYHISKVPADVQHLKDKLAQAMVYSGKQLIS
ncbi:hypothetical protein Sjap_012851 [Stephania japonica]|uniref:Integrator complex subunit 3 n=1 Tax=Stephania japonica TaxID=461633 RepID=A0AAP0NYP1_9MAGN